MRFVVDTSALIALIKHEPEAGWIEALLLEQEPLISGGTLIETQRVLQFWPGPGFLVWFDELIDACGFQIIPVDHAHVAAARDGMLRYGKGRGEAPAALNFGDLFAYAAAKTLDLPLLFKGDHFSPTDVRRVELPA